VTDTAFNLAQVLWDERAALAGRPLPSAAAPNAPAGRIAAVGKDFSQLDASDLPGTYRQLNDDNRWALAVSGGGIRSAAFGLGIIQCFADRRVVSKFDPDQTEPLLQQFDYLSTVSGGGYVGSWLSGWLYHARRLAGAGQAAAVLAALNQRVGDHHEAEPINNLRRNTHYLAPSFSALSPDVWTDIAAIVRNLMLNWLLFFPPMILTVLATKALAFGFADDAVITMAPPLIVALTVTSMLCVLWALTFAAANRPSRNFINLSQGFFLVFDLLVFVVGALLLAFVLVAPGGQQAISAASGWLASLLDPFVSVNIGYVRYAIGAGFGFGLYLVSWLAAYLWKLLPHDAEPYRPEYRLRFTFIDLAGWCVAGIAFGTLVAAGLQLLEWAVNTQIEIALIGAVVLAVPWMLAARIIADVIFVVLVGFLPWPDAVPEYQSRAGGLYTLTLLAWLLWFGLVLFSSWLIHQPFLAKAYTALAGVGGVSGAISLLLGSSSQTTSLVQAAQTTRRYLNLNTIASIAAVIFACVLVIGFSLALDAILALGLNEMPALPVHPAWGPVAIVAAILVAIIAVACLFININRYSLHGLYRNRLVRTFLGASRHEAERELTKNHFTDFDAADSPRIHQLWEHGEAPHGDNWRPLHVINVALNLVSSKNLAWQERMAAPFTFSPLHAGSGSSAFPQGAFRPSYPSPDRLPYGGRYGLTLGTAMAISGAAVSPNMGYNSSPGVSFLMTLFNVRLGWWLGNPKSGNTHYWYPGPGFPLRPFFMEMFGLTSENEPWVYLSDGGHFENLGLYEMIRRRCRLIIVSDAGCDPDYQFDDLGNALRKIWIDLGVRIDVIGLDRLKKRFKRRPTPAPDQPYWAVGRIRYRDADFGGAAGADGLLLYIKAGLHGTECMDVLSYASVHLDFPHESTANQFFTESQFESYRALGYEIAYKALCYAERERLVGATATPEAGNAIAAQPIDNFNVRVSALTLDGIVERLHANLQRTS
jgi:hypothetical protein